VGSVNNDDTDKGGLEEVSDGRYRLDVRFGLYQSTNNDSVYRREERRNVASNLMLWHIGEEGRVCQVDLAPEFLSWISSIATFVSAEKRLAFCSLVSFSTDCVAFVAAS